MIINYIKWCVVQLSVLVQMPHLPDYVQFYTIRVFLNIYTWHSSSLYVCCMKAIHVVLQRKVYTLYWQLDSSDPSSYTDSHIFKYSTLLFSIQQMSHMNIRLMGMSVMVWCHFLSSLVTRFMGPTWGSSGADRTQVGPMLAPWTLLSEIVYWRFEHERMATIVVVVIWGGG